MRSRKFWMNLGLMISIAVFSAAPMAAAPAPPAKAETGASPWKDGFSAIVKEDLPAVVNVSSSKMVRSDQVSSPSSDPFFQQFFGRGQNTPPREEREHSLGSGVIVSPDGYILTNNHVVDKADDVKVMLGDNRQFKAKIVGTDPKTDIAVLKVDATNLPVLSFGDSSKMAVGDIVLAIGNPFGLNQTVTMGIVSATGRGGLGIEDYEDFIQTDAAINPGNSGGALINVDGQVIGINTAILSGGGGNQGIGFAIPINMARQVMDQILEHGHVIRAYLGVMIQPVTPDIAKSFGLSGANGALVGDVTSDSPAEKAGVHTGDVIVDLNGTPVSTSRSLQLEVAMMKPGTEVTLGIMRNGAMMKLPVTLAEMPTQQGAASNQEGASTDALDGVGVDELTPDIAQQLQLPPTTHGVVVTGVDPSSAAAEAGLRRGDVIEQVNRAPTPNIAAFESQMQRAGNGQVLLLVNRGGSTMFMVVQSH